MSVIFVQSFTNFSPGKHQEMGTSSKLNESDTHQILIRLGFKAGDSKMTILDPASLHSLVGAMEELGTVVLDREETQNISDSRAGMGNARGRLRLEFIVDTQDLHLPANQEGAHYGARGLASHLAGTNYSTDSLLGIGFLCMQWVVLGGPKNRIGQFEGILISLL